MTGLIYTNLRDVLRKMSYLLFSTESAYPLAGEAHRSAALVAEAAHRSEEEAHRSAALLGEEAHQLVALLVVLLAWMAHLIHP